MFVHEEFLCPVQNYELAHHETLAFEERVLNRTGTNRVGHEIG